MQDSHTIQPGLTCGHAIARGTIGFAVVSLAGFAIWAFAGKWFYTHVGEAGLYAASAIVFLGLSGLLLHPLVAGPRPVRFYRVFVPAFLLYALAWCAAWFALHFGAGEWLGSFLGCAAFVLVLAGAFRNYRVLPLVIAVLFLAHSAGYFAGGFAMQHLVKSGGAVLNGISKHNIGILGKLLWGLSYGAGFGAGIGYAFHATQKKPILPPPA